MITAALIGIALLFLTRGSSATPAPKVLGPAPVPAPTLQPAALLFPGENSGSTYRAPPAPPAPLVMPAPAPERPPDVAKPAISVPSDFRSTPSITIADIIAAAVLPVPLPAPRIEQQGAVLVPPPSHPVTLAPTVGAPPAPLAPAPVAPTAAPAPAPTFAPVQATTPTLTAVQPAPTFAPVQATTPTQTAAAPALPLVLGTSSVPVLAPAPAPAPAPTVALAYPVSLLPPVRR